MRNLVFVLVSIFFLVSCKKKDSMDFPDPNIIIPDTLTAGWTKAANTGIGISNDIFFTNATTGFVVSSNGIHKSVDGGVNWALFNGNPDKYNIGGFGAKYCFVGGQNKISYTTNTIDFFSPTYTLANTNNPPLKFKDCFFSSANIVYACSEKHIYKSLNGGTSFDSIYVFSDANTNNAVYFFNDLLGWLVRSNGLYKTIDGGLNWNLQKALNHSQFAGAIDFITQDIGVIADGTAVYKTIDGGNSWTTIFTGFSNVFVDVEIISADEIYISGSEKIHKTTNGGTSWSPVLTSRQNGIIEIHFINANTGWACGANGAIYRYKP